MLTEKVYPVVTTIPRGRVSSYKEVARACGSERAYRVVGNILNKNRDKKIPCHRVVKSSGFVGGFAKGTEEKTRLLTKEGLKIRGGKILNFSEVFYKL